MNIREYISQKKKEILIGRLTSNQFQQFFRTNAAELQKMLTYYECAIMEVETRFKVLNQEFSLSREYSPIETIKSRLKSIDSLIEKVERYQVPLSVKDIEDQIEDIAGIRVICSFPEDIYTVADCFLQQDDVALIDCKDYIRNPKENGYRSLHLIVTVPIFLEHEKREVKVEVQLRTIAMDFWASLEHKLKYKKELPADISDRLVGELLECATIGADLDNRMQKIRRQLSEDSSEIDDAVDQHQWF
ncbi:MAG: GTP pyrophosphokinase family protein [Clostridia bacterium]|nr:GTP pyrophosphokinase family protein [Clostridia bacterium]